MNFLLRPILFAGVLLLTAEASAQESCANAIDDDGDGLVDLNDTTDCACSVILGGGGIPSILPNQSFEDYDCQPVSYSQLDCATDWNQATFSTSDYFLAPTYMPPWIQQPLPGGGDGCVGGYFCHDYMEYIGGCLLAPIEAGTSYTLSMAIAGFEIDNFLTNTAPLDLSPVNVTVYGLASCPTFPTSVSLCPGNEGWTELGYATYTPSESWSEIAITFEAPFDVQAIMFGSPCTLPPDYPNVFDPWLAYFIFDDLILNETALFSTIEQTGGFCTDDLELIGHLDTLAVSYQWFYQGEALIGQVDTILGISENALDTGWYQFVTYLDTACAISETWVAPPIYVPPFISNPSVASCFPLNIQFENGTDTSQVLSMTWDFGDGSPTSDDYEPQHYYDEPGTYDVTLSLLSDQECPTDTTYTTLITINQVPEPTFTADLLEGCIGMTVNFTNTTDTLSASCSWDFGDGGSSNLCDPAHTYNIADTFSVELTVTSAAGCVEDTTITQMITVFAEPSVSFTLDTVAGCTPLTIHFLNTTPANQVGTMAWDLGAGQTSDINNPTAIYDSAGVYTVSLLVTHPLGCFAEVEEVDLITAYGHPVVTFTNEPDSGCYPLEVQFVNTTDPAFTNLCNWEFGTGDTSTLCIPNYTYQDPGVYSVKLEVISPQNCEGDTTITDLITVFDHPEAAFVFGPQPTDIFDTYLSFFDSSSVDAIQWDWEFGDEGVIASSTDEHPVLYFPDDPGIYPVQLVVTNIHTCTDTMVRNVVIDPYYAVYAPNAFTPDGDGINDYFYPMIRDDRKDQYRLSIYDRWGGKVYESSNWQNVWAGTDMNREGELVPTGVYVWHLKTATAKDGINKEYYGHVTLLR